MTTLILNLLWINLIMVLIHESGFIENIDEWISEKYKFHHLPYPIRCCLCGVNWLSILYILVTGQFSLFTLLLCLINAHLTKITQPLYRLAENIALKIIELLNRWLKL